jgi:hypothetical protein
MNVTVVIFGKHSGNKGLITKPAELLKLMVAHPLEG